MWIVCEKLPIENLPLIVQCNCYMTDGNSGVYHVKYNKRMPTVWAKSPDVRFFLFLG